MKELSNVNVPSYILQGDTDIVKEVKASGNFCSNCRIVANSGHMPGQEGMDAVFETLVEAVEMF